MQREEILLEDILQEIDSVQVELAEAQAKMITLKEQLYQHSTEVVDVEEEVFLKAYPSGMVKISVPEHPPRLSVFHLITKKENGRYCSKAKQNCRNRWYSLIRKAAQTYTGPRVSPAFIFIVYYVPVKLKRIDADNFSTKFVIDGLMYAGITGEDDSRQHVRGYAVEIKEDSADPRTEIYVLPFQNQLYDIVK